MFIEEVKSELNDALKYKRELVESIKNTILSESKEGKNNVDVWGKDLITSISLINNCCANDINAKTFLDNLGYVINYFEDEGFNIHVVSNKYANDIYLHIYWD